MQITYTCDWCFEEFLDKTVCKEHEAHCHNNPETKSCETCGHYDCGLSPHGNICEVGLLPFSDLYTNRATNCIKWILTKFV